MAKLMGCDQMPPARPDLASGRDCVALNDLNDFEDLKVINAGPDLASRRAYRDALLVAQTAKSARSPENAASTGRLSSLSLRSKGNLRYEAATAGPDLVSRPANAGSHPARESHPARARARIPSCHFPIQKTDFRQNGWNQK
jgi:hypothetical protein